MRFWLLDLDVKVTPSEIFPEFVSRLWRLLVYHSLLCSRRRRKSLGLKLGLLLGHFCLAVLCFCSLRNRGGTVLSSCFCELSYGLISSDYATTILMLRFDFSWLIIYSWNLVHSGLSINLVKFYNYICCLLCW